jgi:hypothetical protein
MCAVTPKFCFKFGYSDQKLPYEYRIKILLELHQRCHPGLQGVWLNLRRRHGGTCA